MALYKIEEFYPNYREELFDGDDIKGLDVYAGKTRDKIGSIETALVDEEGRFRYFVIDTGFWIFGKKIEFESNKLFYSFLILSSAFMSSACQLIFSNDTGIGLSGVVYAFFGFMFISRKWSENFRNFLEKSTIQLFFFWLLLCIVLSQLQVWMVGNAAHVGGLLWGAGLAYLSKYSKNRKIIEQS